jgi:hypothetical protein
MNAALATNAGGQAMDDPLLQALHQGLSRLTVRAWRLTLSLAEVQPTVPLLRGVWGAALHDLDRRLYDSLFEGKPGGTPGYLLRPASGSSERGFMLDFLLFGAPEAAAEELAWSAWELALQRGLGPQRVPARLEDVRPVAWDGTLLTPARRQPGFALAPLPWPGSAARPCRLVFPTPLRLLRDGCLIAAPTVADLTLAALRRFNALAPEAADPSWAARSSWLGLARALPAEPFRGEACDFVRYSGRQKTEIELRGVVGELSLPQGPGLLAELLLASTWLHLGKSTVQGLGQVRIEVDNGWPA